ncbi:hypothetical protein ACSSV8_003724 [Roseovarius sp. MBR-79]|jgi:hypothetical protein
MKKEINSPVLIPVPAEVASMSPKEVIVLMRALGVGKFNGLPPWHARGWTTAEFLDRCLDTDVLRGTLYDPPERTTVEGWFSLSGPLPNDRRHKTWHFFFHVFFNDGHRGSGTAAWRDAYFAALTRAKVAAARSGTGNLPLVRPTDACTGKILLWEKTP